MEFLEALFAKVITKPSYETNHENNIFDHGFTKGVAVTLLAVGMATVLLYEVKQEIK